MGFQTFTRAWWKEATRPGWPDNLEPNIGARKTYAKYFDKESEARDYCEEYNSTHDPGRYSVKMEYERA